MAAATHLSCRAKKDGSLRRTDNDGLVPHGLKWQIPLLGLLLALAMANRCECQSLLPEVKAASAISRLVLLKLHSGSNDVTFWGICSATDGDVPCHDPGKIYQFEAQGVVNTYYATVKWKTPSFLVPLEDETPYEGEDSAPVPYIGNMDVFYSGANFGQGLQQFVGFFQGLLKGKQRTFFVITTIPFSTFPPEARSADIQIFAFSGGTAPPDFTNPPGFQRVDSLKTKTSFCDAKYATLVTLMVGPPPLNPLHDRQISLRPGAKQQTCP